MSRFWIVTLGIAAFTQLSRLLRFFLLDDRRLPPWWERFFQCAPTALLAALIFPEVLGSTGDLISAAGACLIAVILAWRHINPTVIVALTVLSAAALQWFVSQ